MEIRWVNGWVTSSASQTIILSTMAVAVAMAVTVAIGSSEDDCGNGGVAATA